MGEKPQTDMLYILAGIDKVKFRRQVIPGDQLELRAELIKRKRNIWKFSTEALVDGKRAATAEITCVVTEKN
jgi:3-hydroxyacyl-[acyl-carrier-protein] dehydratase